MMNVTGLTGLGKKRIAFQGKVNAFHDLLEPIREALRNFLQEVSRLPKEVYSSARTWLGQLPPTPKEAGHLLLDPKQACPRGHRASERRGEFA
jgi:hypothetical protein